MPPRICFDELDVEAPSNLNDEDLDESTTDLQPHPKDILTATSFQLALLQSFPVCPHIVQLLNSLRSEPTYPRVLELSLALTEALQACASFTKHCGPFHRNLLDKLVRRFALPLHMSFSCRSRTEPTYRYSRQASLNAGLTLLEPEPDARFARLMAVGGGIFREGQRCAFMEVRLELLAQERVRLGETSVKAHMFLSIILAQVEAVEAGVPVELEVARSARDSPEFCCGILSARAGDIAAPLAAPVDVGDAAA